MAFVLFLSLLLSSFLLYLSFHRLSRRRRTLPPGRLGLPFIGETLHLISAYKTDNPEPFMDDRVKRYGPLFTTHLFGEPTVVSADPEVNRYILHNEGKLFESSYPSSISNLLGRHSLLLMKGGLHNKMHSLTMSFANSTIIKDHLLMDMDRIIRLNLDSWDQRVLLLNEAKKMTFALSMKQLMSFDPNEWTERLRKEYLLLIDGFFGIPVPLFFTTYGRAIKARTKVADALRSVVRERRKAFNNKENDKSSRKDMLEAMLEGENSFSDEEIVDFLLALLVAGYETTSTLMTLAVKFLTETPLALAQLKEEHEKIRKRKNTEALEWTDYKSMPFTQCVINETLRIANIIGAVFRRATTDVKLKGYTIPKGCKLFVSFRAVHLNNDYYKDARTYDPWRWQNKEDSSIPPSTASSQGNTYTPFAAGARICPGYELARVQTSVFLHHLVTKFSWEAAEQDKLVFFPTTRTQKNYPIHVCRLVTP